MGQCLNVESARPEFHDNCFFYIFFLALFKNELLVASFTDVSSFFQYLQMVVVITLVGIGISKSAMLAHVSIQFILMFYHYVL